MIKATDSKLENFVLNTNLTLKKLEEEDGGRVHNAILNFY